MRELRVLTMTGNPVVNIIPAYRKTLILECKNLTYLDSRPVFDRDRACAVAWKRGGHEEERKELQRWKREEQRKIRRSINATLRMRHRGDGEPELLRTSSDEEDSTPRNGKKCASIVEIEPKSNEQAWNEVEQILCKSSAAAGSHGVYQRFASNRGGGIEDEVDQANDDSDSDINEVHGSKKVLEDCQSVKKLIEEIVPAEEGCINDSAEKMTDDTFVLSTAYQGNKRKLIEEITSDHEEYVPTNDTPINDEPKKVSEIGCGKGFEIPTDEQEPIVEIENKTKIANKMDKVKSTELEDDTLNVVIKNNDGISITMESKEGELISMVESRPASSAEKLYKSVSSKEEGGSESEPSEVLNENREHKSSSASDVYSSDSGDMFDRIVPTRHRKLATNYCTESDSNSSNDSEQEAEKFPDKLEREKSIADYIDEYKKFFQSAKVLDSEPGQTNRNKIVRPQTAKYRRTYPIVYEGVLKSIERDSNEVKIQEAKVKADQSRRSVIDRLMKQQQQEPAVMNLEEMSISIGGEEHNFNEYRLDVFRKDQEKLQALIDRVTAQKDKYNAHIDQIHDQLANIMDDYGQISEKLRKVDDLIKNISNEEKLPCDDRQDSQEATNNVENHIVEELESHEDVTHIDEHEESKTAVQTIVNEIIFGGKKSGSLNNLMDESDNSAVSSSEESTDEDETPLISQDSTVLELLASPKPIIVPEEKLGSHTIHDFTQDPVYQKFIEIQEEIDELTEDELYNIVAEASEELSEDPKVTQCLNSAVDQYWKKFDDVEDFRKNINLDSHPIIQKFRQYIRCHCEADEQEEAMADTVANLDKACRKLERRLSNHLFDEYLILSRKQSIATIGGESSANEIELIEIEEGPCEVSLDPLDKTTAWNETETVENTSAPCVTNVDRSVPSDINNQDFEDDESKPVPTMEEENVVKNCEPLETDMDVFFDKRINTNNDIENDL
ncbi:dynein axonemal assembly factor 1 homolog isoform X2 [Toxorhynchites rutilus septentrionalis]|nr:dynein axonemal assembly factor 1 homolog isoform X2 [Toxorhynchites rutilus septentrionalis]XP_055644568.1 dynein axonemal assembly factor 1 homolog isoform X2 [Toxorhynchites rutilus septentrionalis]